MSDFFKYAIDLVAVLLLAFGIKGLSRCVLRVEPINWLPWRWVWR